MSVYVMLLPAVTGAGSSALVTERSADGLLTLVVTVSLLFPGQGSFVSLVTVTAFVITEPSGVFAFTFTTSVKLAVTPAASVGMVQLMEPVPPTGGVPHVNAGPPFC